MERPNSGLYLCPDCRGAAVRDEQVCSFCHGHGTIWGENTPIAHIIKVNQIKARQNRKVQIVIELKDDYIDLRPREETYGQGEATDQEAARRNG